ncbi:unnamed protein product [Prunus brigantina]
MSRLLKPIGGFVKVILSLNTPHGQYILQVVPFAFLLSLYQASGEPINLKDVSEIGSSKGAENDVEVSQNGAALLSSTR